MARPICAGGAMPAVPARSITVVSHHAHDCSCKKCERELNLERKRIARERAVAAFGEGRC